MFCTTPLKYIKFIFFSFKLYVIGEASEVLNSEVSSKELTYKMNFITGKKVGSKNM